MGTSAEEERGRGLGHLEEKSFYHHLYGFQWILGGYIFAFECDMAPDPG